MPFQNCGQNRRQKINAFLMTIWLCSWVGITVFHNLSHAVHPDEHHAPCVVCHLLHSGAPETVPDKLVVSVLPVFECVLEIATETIPFRSQISFVCATLRGPPAISVV